MADYAMSTNQTTAWSMRISDVRLGEERPWPVLANLTDEPGSRIEHPNTTLQLPAQPEQISANPSREQEAISGKPTSEVKGPQDSQLFGFYRPLDESRQEIRLLKVYLRSHSDDLHCDLDLHCDVGYFSLLEEPKPEYMTISYCWGDSTRSSKILLNGQPFYVPENTKLALWRMVDKELGKYRILWIDAVCINQDDKAERASQVALMGKIYSSSQGNLIYLSGSSNCAQEIADSLHSIEKDIESIVGADESWEDYATLRAPSDVWDIASIDQEALAELFSSPWFT